MKGSFLRPREKGREGDRLCLILILLVWLAALKCLFNGIYYSAETTIILLAFCFRMSHLWCLRWDSKWTWEHVLTLSFIQFQLFNNQRTYACTFWFWRTKKANSWEVLAMVIYIIHLHSTSPLGVCCNHTARSALLWKCDFLFLPLQAWGTSLCARNLLVCLHWGGLMPPLWLRLPHFFLPL